MEALAVYSLAVPPPEVAEPAAIPAARGGRMPAEPIGLHDALDMYPRVLSNEPGIHEATGHLRQWLCLRTAMDGSEGVLLITADHAAKHEVLQYKHRLKVGRVQFRTIEGSLEDIAAAASGTEALQVGRLEPAQQQMMDQFRRANQLRASDIHIQVKRKVTLVRYRILGRLKTYARLTREEGLELISALYNTMTYDQETDLDARKDQGAQLRAELARQVGMAGARIATRPAIGPQGMRFTIRLIQNFSASRSLADCGYSTVEHIPQLDYMLDRAFGMVVITGVTGSGKSQTLAVAQRQLAESSNDELNIMTIEDPPEGEIDRDAICQTPLIYDRTDPTAKDRAWPLALSSLMRHDPDVISPGEVRDSLSAKGAAEAALTGHLVLTTLHVQEACAVPERLRELGVSDQIVFNPSYLVGLVNQSLVPVLCPDCRRRLPVGGAGVMGRVQYERLSKVLKGDLAGVFVRAADGTECATCKGTQVVDRTLVAEVLTPNAAFFECYRREGMLAAKRYAMTHMAFKTKIQHALEKIRGGFLDPRDAQRVLGPLDLDEITTGVVG